MEPSDEKLMERYAAGDLSAFRALFQRYENRIYNFFLRRLGDPERAADLFQELFLRLHRNRHRFDPGRPFAIWLFTIANNLVRDNLRMTRSLDFERVETEDALPPSKSATPEESAAAAEVGEKIAMAIQALPEAQKEVLLLARFEGLSHKQIAEITGRSRLAARQLLYRALQNLRRRLSEV